MKKKAMPGYYGKNVAQHIQRRVLREQARRREQAQQEKQRQENGR